MTDHLTIVDFEEEESKSLYINNKRVYTGSYWDFHPGCVGTTFSYTTLTGEKQTMDLDWDEQSMEKAIVEWFQSRNLELTISEIDLEDGEDICEDTLTLEAQSRGRSVLVSFFTK